LILVLDSTECLSAAVPLATFEKSGSTHLHVSRADLVASTALLAYSFAPATTAFPVSTTAFPALLANYFAASAAPATPFLAHAANYYPASLAFSTPSTIPFFNFAALSFNLLTILASHLHLSPFLKEPSKLSFNEANNLFADLFL